MSTTTAQQLGADAFALLNVFQPGATVPAADKNFAFRALNGMIGQWQLDTTTAPITIREVFPLVAGQGGPDLPYTIGPGGDFDTTRPTLDSITGIALLLMGSVPPVELPRSAYTDGEYQAIQIKDLANGLFTGASYNPTYTGGLGSFYLWPVPNVSVDQFVLYRQQPLAAFVSLTASYDLPDGYEEAIVYNLALRLGTPYGRSLDDDAKGIAARGFAMVGRSNVQLNDMQISPMFTNGWGFGRGGYNINSGE